MAGARKWRLNHSPLFLDFLEGKVDFPCTAWGIPSYSVLGWQRPCYLMADGYASSYQELLATTDWDKYGRGKDPRCANCMAHCGYEPSAVTATMKSPRESLRATIDVLSGSWQGLFTSRRYSRTRHEDGEGVAGRSGRNHT